MTNLKNKLRAIALVGTFWLGSHCGCDVNSACLNGVGVYDAVAGYVTGYEYYGYDAVEYDPGCCGGGDEFYFDGGFYAW